MKVRRLAGSIFAALTLATICQIDQAGAQDSDIVAACKLATEVHYMIKSLKVKEVQDFSNLKPPRARISYDTLIGANTLCKFRSATKPVGITEYCVDGLCLNKGSESFEDIAEMLRRAGY